MLVQIGLGDRLGIGNNDLRALAEPGVEPPVEGHGGKNGDNDGGHHGDYGEHGHQTGVELRPRRPTDARNDDADNSPRNQGEQDKHSGEVCQQQGNHQPTAGLQRREAGQRHIGERAKEDSNDHQANGQGAGKPPLRQQTPQAGIPTHAQFSGSIDCRHIPSCTRTSRRKKR